MDGGEEEVFDGGCGVSGSELVVSVLGWDEGLDWDGGLDEFEMGMCIAVVFCSRWASDEHGEWSGFVVDGLIRACRGIV